MRNQRLSKTSMVPTPRALKSMRAKNTCYKGYESLLKTEVPKQGWHSQVGYPHCTQGSEAPVRVMAEEEGWDTHHRAYHSLLVCLQPEEGAKVHQS